MDINELKEKERKAFLRIGEVSEEEAKKLLQELSEACGSVGIEEDYEWLNKAIIRWETYLKAEFGVIFLTPIKELKQGLKSERRI